MAETNNLQFSQANLQDYQDCRRRFFYRYNNKLSWPAIESEPAEVNEAWMLQGAAFHRLVHQYLLGMPVEDLARTITGDKLAFWWENYLSAMPVDRSGIVYPELMLASQLAGHTLLAKYDLVMVDGQGDLMIFDWKTRPRPSPRSVLELRLQTKVYRFVLALVGHKLLGDVDVAPEKIQMTYWFASHPGQTEVFQYDSNKMDDDEKLLTSMINEIVSLGEDLEDFPMTPELINCRFCVYRSLCRRGVEAGKYDELDDDLMSGLDDGIDFDQIQEIEF